MNHYQQTDSFNFETLKFEKPKTSTKKDEFQRNSNIDTQNLNKLYNGIVK